MNEKTFVHLYIDYHNQYVKKYGENTVVLIQTGSHFNVFAVINDDLNDGPDIYHICKNIMNIEVVKQNKKTKEISYKNCLLAGFPVNSIQKYENILLNQHYTVVIIEQISAPPNPERGVTRILSPGTILNEKQDSNYLMSIYVEKNEYVSKESYNVGISVIDLSTGKNYLHSILSKIEDDNYWSDEIGRFIHFYNPSELIFQFKNCEYDHNKIIQLWDISHNSIQINHYNDPLYFKIDYQNEFLQKVYQLNIMDSAISYFDLEFNSELVISLLFLLLYVHDHRTESLTNIEKPEIIQDHNYLSLTSNSIRQLNIIHNYSYFKGKNDSLLSVCNVCVTPMGRRLFKERLLYPSIDSKIINERYNFIDLFREDYFYEIIQKDLRKVSDLEKSLRKMGLNILQPNELFSDSLSFEYVNKVIDHLKKNEIIMEKYGESDIITTFRKFHSIIENTFEFQNFSLNSVIERSYFKVGVNPQLNEYDKLTDDYLHRLTLIIKRFSKLLDNSETNIKYDFDDKNGWHIYCTNKRASTFKERLKNIHNHSIHIKENNEIIYTFQADDFSFKKKDKMNTILCIKTIDDLSKKFIIIQDKLIKLNKTQWFISISKIYQEYNQSLKEFYGFLSEMDVYCSAAKISIQNNYCRPKIIQKEKSFLNVKNIRHPIVEKINTETEYVTNDLHLGEGKDGILLFGTNACGKSTLMKAVGLNIILAQAGLFVSASSFEFKPYTQIFTRILNNDNIFRSQSSFAVEIQELKSILNRSDKNSLILGDELCSGTETKSALCIISSGLNTLCKRKSTFIFTSHLHELTQLKEINDLENLKIYHLKINYDKEKNLLIYDRKLEEGSGPSIYGLQVCEAMGLSNDFCSYAKQMLNKLEDKQNIIDTKKSIYNSNILMDHCEICNSKDDLETHHIQDQQFADKNNMIDHFHKNNKHNLVPLCKSCHLKVTNHELIVSGWIQTSSGKKLEWKKNNKKIISKKKVSEKEIEQIKKFKIQYHSLSQNDFVKRLELNHKIKISVTTLRKILNNNY